MVVMRGNGCSRWRLMVVAGSEGCDGDDVLW